MVDIQSFALSLPSFIERSYFISPGVVSVIFKVIWSVFTFIIVTLLIEYGLGAVAIKDSENKQKTLWKAQRDYTRVQSISNGRWGSMIFNIRSTRVILGFLFWIFIYAFELLFSLSIDNSYLTIYNGTQCVGRVDNLTSMASSMWFNTARSGGGNVPATNSTFLRQLLNQQRVGNFVLLGDGIFAVSPDNMLYKENQTINVARAGFNCDDNSTLYMKKSPQNLVYMELPSGENQYSNFSTPHFNNISMTDIGDLVSGYINLKNIIPLANQGNPPMLNNHYIFLILISNPTNAIIDINSVVYNNSVFLTECVLSYEYGYVTITKDGYLNETNINGSYTKVENKTLDLEFDNSFIDNNAFENKYFLSTIDYPDIFLNTDYNKTYLDTMKIANNIVSAHMLSGLNQAADLCSFNQEQVPVYVSVLGTRMSFGYIMIGVIFVVVTIAILFVFAFTMFTQEERKQWLLYTIDWRFIGYLSKGENMNQRQFKEYAKEAYIHGDNNSKNIFEVSEDERLHSDTLLRKEA